jgi:hypothetical protein
MKSEAFNATHINLYSSKHIRTQNGLLYKRKTVPKTLKHIAHKVLSNHSKISLAYEYNMAEYVLSHMLLKLIITRV